jgi:hypothetical protein
MAAAEARPRRAGTRHGLADGAARFLDLGLDCDEPGVITWCIGACTMWTCAHAPLSRYKTLTAAFMGRGENVKTPSVRQWPEHPHGVGPRAGRVGFLLLWKKLGRPRGDVCAGSIGLQSGMDNPRVSFLPASLDPPGIGHQGPVHRRGGWDGILDPARDHPRRDIRQAGAPGNAGAMGSRDPACCSLLRSTCSEDTCSISLSAGGRWTWPGR